MTAPKLTIMLLTYTPACDHPRASYAEKTLRSALSGLCYSGQISVHIADDGSPQAHRDRLYDIAGGYPHVKGVSVTDAHRDGYGANYNLATQTVHTNADVVLPLEDDWIVAHPPLDLDPLVAALSDGLGCIRLGYLGFTQTLFGRVIAAADDPYLLLDPSSPEPHVFAGHPRIESVEWEREVGPWPEGMNPGATEFAVAHMPQARRRVGWPLFLNPPAFAHIGTIQARDDQ